MFEYDETKRSSALKKHGIDFLDAVEIFGTDYLCLSGRTDIEIREIAVRSGIWTEAASRWFSPCAMR